MATTADYLALSDAMYTKFGAAPVAPVGWTLLETKVVTVEWHDGRVVQE